MRQFGRSAIAAAVLAVFAGVAGAVGAALAQTPVSAPQGASVKGDTWCLVVLQQDLARFQDRVTQVVASGGEVRASNYVVTGDGTYFYALVCRATSVTSGST